MLESLSAERLPNAGKHCRDADAPDGHMVVAYRIAHAIITEYGVTGGLVAYAVSYGASLIRPGVRGNCRSGRLRR